MKQERKEEVKQSQSEETKATSEPDEKKSSNFYKINWRVVGGGVKIGTDSQ